MIEEFTNHYVHQEFVILFDSNGNLLFLLLFYNLKIVGNALDIVLHIWVIDLNSF